MITNASGSKRFVHVADDLTEMVALQSYNPKQFPNGMICTAADTGTVYVMIEGLWEVVGTNT